METLSKRERELQAQIVNLLDSSDLLRRSAQAAWDLVFEYQKKLGLWPDDAGWTEEGTKKWVTEQRSDLKSSEVSCSASKENSTA